VGQVHNGIVTRIMPFGAFVSFMGNSEGLVHISELAPGHVREVEDVVKIGDEVNVKVIEIDSMGRVNLSKVQADMEKGLLSDEEVEEMNRSRERSRQDRGSRSGGGGRSSNRSGGDRRSGRSGGGNRGNSGSGGRTGGRSRR